MSEPTRLRDDPSLAPELRSDLTRAAEAEPRYDVERGLLALHAAIGTLAASASSAGGAVAEAGQAGAGAAQTAATQAGLLGGKAALAKWITALGIGVASAGALTLQGGEPVGPAAPAKVAAPAPQAPGPKPTPAETPAAAPTAPEPAAEAPRATEPAATNAPIDRDRALRAEIAHLARVKALLPRDPEAAYALAQAGNRTLSGMLRQERDGLSVVALDAAGKQEHAQRLAQRFLERYPSSPLRARVAAIAAAGTP